VTCTLIPCSLLYAFFTDGDGDSSYDAFEMKKRKIDEQPSRPARASDRQKNKGIQREEGGSSAVRTKSTAGKKTKKKGPDLGPSETEVPLRKTLMRCTSVSTGS
jgi:hypothetical protein